MRELAAEATKGEPGDPGGFHLARRDEIESRLELGVACHRHGERPA